jgi:hypothetical protein
MHSSAEGAWIAFEAEEHYTVEPPGFAWDATMRKGILPIARGRDMYATGEGYMLIRAGSLFTVVDARGPEMVQGSMMRYLSEMIWFPTAFLGEHIAWEAVDDDSSRVTLTNRGRSVSATMYFDEEGRFRDFVGERYRTVEGATTSRRGRPRPTSTGSWRVSSFRSGEGPSGSLRRATSSTPTSLSPPWNTTWPGKLLAGHIMTTEAVPRGRPRLTFVCELDRAHLTELFSEGSVIDDLKALGAHVLLMLSDFSPERADVVKGLNVASVGSMKLTRFAAQQLHWFRVSDGKVTEYWAVRDELAHGEAARGYALKVLA